MKSFVTSQFDYYPLIWMYHSRHLNNEINSIHERALRITYQNTSTFQELLNKGKSGSIQHRNLQVLANEILKFTEAYLQKFSEKHLCPKKVRIIFAEMILLNEVKCTLYTSVLNCYRF